MRRQQMIAGFNNKQTIRFIVNGMAMFGTVQGIQNIATTKHRVAVWQSLEKLALDRVIAKQLGRTLPTGLAWTLDVRNECDLLERMDVQVDICSPEAHVW